MRRRMHRPPMVHAFRETGLWTAAWLISRRSYPGALPTLVMNPIGEVAGHPRKKYRRFPQVGSFAFIPYTAGSIHIAVCLQSLAAS